MNTRKIIQASWKAPVLMAGLLLFVMATAAGQANRDGAQYQKLAPAETKKFLEDNPKAILLDVRTPEEYAQVHIPGSVLIPDYELAARMLKELPDHNAPIVVYCRSGNRSRNAVMRLLQEGYTNVYDAGGINVWPYKTESGAYKKK